MIVVPRGFQGFINLIPIVRNWLGDDDEDEDKNEEKS